MTIRVEIGAGGTYAPHHYYQDSKWGRGTRMLTVERAANGFNNCGSRIGSNSNGYFGTSGTHRTLTYPNGYNKPPVYLDPPNEQELFELKAEFLAAYLNNTGRRFSLYMLPATYQVQQYAENPYSVMHLLLELGAEFIDKRPNLNHGPNQMCLLVWTPSKAKNLSKYIVKDITGFSPAGEIPYRPRKWEYYQKDLTQQVEAAKAKVAVAKVFASKQYRDANGRFAKRGVI